MSPRPQALPMSIHTTNPHASILSRAPSLHYLRGLPLFSFSGSVHMNIHFIHRSSPKPSHITKRLFSYVYSPALLSPLFSYALVSPACIRVLDIIVTDSFQSPQTGLLLKWPVSTAFILFLTAALNPHTPIRILALTLPVTTEYVL